MKREMLHFSVVTRGLIFAAALALGTLSYAVHDLGLFELDRNAQDGPAAGNDWNTFFPGPSMLPNPRVFVPDGSSGATIFIGGQSKDDLDLPGWRHTTWSVPDKDDLTNAYAVLYQFNGQNIIYFGADRFANNGDAQLGFWFFKNAIGLNPNGTFSGVHAN